ncbi:hypothetical protein DM01DRAFT_1228104 [Hesseltinella vesiculosa]|uniref:Uncharacterized protein n=1 Tax=Hesseltinella vesiculosa TaxID=101127 RepID=A0A1X2GMW0_9FUNG|nr:hypothetical protein DM01DRAFT_1228104 [Hesseltinella vesiculosa]
MILSTNTPTSHPCLSPRASMVMPSEVSTLLPSNYLSSHDSTPSPSYYLHHSHGSSMSRHTLQSYPPTEQKR